jgi:DNA-binding NtrC family response regulator
MTGMRVGKHYKKGDPIRGAAILLLTMELQGQSPKVIKQILKDTFKDLGITQKAAEQYLDIHRSELTSTLKGQGIE